MALVIPNNDIVDIFNYFWTNNPVVNEVILFEGGDNIDVSAFVQDFRGLIEQDTNIRNINELSVFLSEINSKYNTRVPGGVNRIVEKLSEHNIASKQVLIDLVNNDQLSLPEFVNICRQATGNYTYSFATKVFSFIDANDRFPIVDSFAVTMLEAYWYDYEYEGYVPKKHWGNYEQYRTNYSNFKAAFLIDRSNRKTDRFLWTYGKILDAYWKQQGVLRFNSIPFTPNNN